MDRQKDVWMFAWILALMRGGMDGWMNRIRGGSMNCWDFGLMDGCML